LQAWILRKITYLDVYKAADLLHRRESQRIAKHASAMPIRIGSLPLPAGHLLPEKRLFAKVDGAS
jgi:hypothetical protein